MNGSVDSKPFKGYIKDWKICKVLHGPDFGRQYITGKFDGHPSFHGNYGHSSLIEAMYDADDHWDVYTLNSHYKLRYDEEEPDREFWDMS